MYVFFLSILALLFGAGILFFGPKVKVNRAVAAAPLVLGVLMLALSSTTIIQAKNVGVITTFGRPTGDGLGSGLHAKAPWQKVTELDGTKITNRYELQAGVGDSRLPVRIGDGTTAHVSTAIRWSIVPNKADDIYADYRSDDVNVTLRESLVETVFGNAINQVFGTYNPTADLKVVEPGEDASVDFVPDYDALAAEVTASMEKRVAETGGYVKIDFITISGLDLSDTTQSKINEFQAEVAKTQVAMQEKRTATEKAAANNILAESTRNSNVLTSRCFDIMRSMVDQGIAVPVGGLGCWGEKDNLILPGAQQGGTPTTP